MKLNILDEPWEDQEADVNDCKVLPPKTYIQYGERFAGKKPKEDNISPEEYGRALDTQVGGDHYRSCKIQPIEYIMANNLDWFEGNIIKYTTRHKKKGGKADLEKVIHYAQMAIEHYYGKELDNVR